MFKENIVQLEKVTSDDTGGVGRNSWCFQAGGCKVGVGRIDSGY